MVLWGLGSALGFPVGMSAAADDPQNAAARVSAVATTMFALLADHAGHPLKIEKLKPDEMLAAMIASFDGDERRLANVIHGLIE